MATIPQKIQAPGQASADQEKIKEQYHLSLEEAAAFFQELSRELRSRGVIEMGTPSLMISIAAQEPIPLDLAYKVEKGRKRLRIKVDIEERQSLFSGPSGRPEIGPR
ncbi:hypothetical protein [Candidatus Methanocrinis natronophilus]|uniref:Amphi-Trp domain-containing protein n=1 Tax=Candidatus Methanocrinis natronophilus TaxID=3033396 RepID=A0ABT5XB75_9EURY|nr:hypothetical protein [Candidatus Methanocrinis natronophilus]MDF0591906.1 hypothetical protein [Candidatus Methanocrinis natronophilus]